MRKPTDRDNRRGPIGRQVAGLAMLIAVALGGAGCNTYSYFDIHVLFDDSFSTKRRGTVHACHVFVSGAASGDANLDKCAQPETKDVGHFDFSTYAESGSVTFTVKVFKGFGAAEQIGEGSTTLTVAAGNTAKGDLIAKYTGMDPAD